MGKDTASRFQPGQSVRLVPIDQPRTTSSWRSTLNVIVPGVVAANESRSRPAYDQHGTRGCRRQADRGSHRRRRRGDCGRTSCCPSSSADRPIPQIAPASRRRRISCVAQPGVLFQNRVGVLAEHRRRRPDAAGVSDSFTGVPMTRTAPLSGAAAAIMSRAASWGSASVSATVRTLRPGRRPREARRSDPAASSTPMRDRARLQRVVVFHAARVCRETRIRREIRPTEHDAEAPELVVVADREHESPSAAANVS